MNFGIQKIIWRSLLGVLVCVIPLLFWSFSELLQQIYNVRSEWWSHQKSWFISDFRSLVQTPKQRTDFWPKLQCLSSMIFRQLLHSGSSTWHCTFCLPLTGTGNLFSVPGGEKISPTNAKWQWSCREPYKEPGGWDKSKVLSKQNHLKSWWMEGSCTSWTIFPMDVEKVSNLKDEAILEKEISYLGNRHSSGFPNSWRCILGYSPLPVNRWHSGFRLIPQKGSKHFLAKSNSRTPRRLATS